MQTDFAVFARSCGPMQACVVDAEEDLVADAVAAVAEDNAAVVVPAS